VKKIPLIAIFFIFILFQSTLSRIFPQVEQIFFLPNLPLILLVYVALFAGPEQGTVVGFLIGFFEDSLSIELMGINALVKTVLGFVLGLTASKVVISNRVLQFVCVVLLTFLNEGGRELLKAILGQSIFQNFTDCFLFFALKVLPESLINGLLALIIFLLFERWNLTQSASDGN